MLCFLNYPSLLRSWLSLQGIASVLHVLIPRMQHKVTKVTPSATPATYEDGIHPCKLQQMLELCYLYCKALSFCMQNRTHCSGRGSLKFCCSRGLFRSYIWSGMQIFLAFVHLWASHIRTCKAPRHLSGYQMYSLFYRFVASGRYYACDLYLLSSPLVFRISIRKNPFPSQTLTCLR